MILCPLCKSENIYKGDFIHGKSLSILYNKLFQKKYQIDFKDDVFQYECENCGIYFYDPKLAGDEKFYEALQLFDWYYSSEKPEYEYVQKLIKSGDSVLDVGCGKGAFSKFVVSAGGNFVGLEFSKKAKDTAEKDGINIFDKSIQNFSNEYPSSFDVVVSFQVCEHVPDIGGFIEGKLKALKNNGLMIIAVPSFDSFLRYVSNGFLNMPPHHISLWPDKVFSFIAKKYDLKLIDIYHEPIQNIHKRWFISTLIQNSFIDFKKVDLTLGRKFFNLLSIFFARLLERGLSEKMNVRGHTVIAVFKKK